jgi:hypothetical protein
VPLSLLRVAIAIAAIWVRKAKRHGNEEKLRYLESIDFNLLSNNVRYLREYRGLKLVEVRSKDGDEVTIIV